MKKKSLAIFAATSLVIITFLFISSVAFAEEELCECKGTAWSEGNGGDGEHRCSQEGNGTECVSYDTCIDDVVIPAVNRECGEGTYENCSVYDTVTQEGDYTVNTQTTCLYTTLPEGGGYCAIVTSGTCQATSWTWVDVVECWAY